jgi:hypothetical protein
MLFVMEHFCQPNFLVQPIRREEKFGPTLKFPIYEQKCELSKQTYKLASPQCDARKKLHSERKEVRTVHFAHLFFS